MIKSTLRGAAIAAGALSLCLGAQAASAQTVVRFSGTVLNSCILALSTPGVLTSQNGTQLTSTVPALLSVTAIGDSPRVSFTAPAMATKPTGYTRSPTVEMAYTSLSGANQAYTTGASSYRGGILIDVYTVNARATDNDGFPSGGYAIESTATCQQN